MFGFWKKKKITENVVQRIHSSPPAPGGGASSKQRSSSDLPTPNNKLGGSQPKNKKHPPQTAFSSHSSSSSSTMKRNASKQRAVGSLENKSKKKKDKDEDSDSSSSSDCSSEVGDFFDDEEIFVDEFQAGSKRGEKRNSKEDSDIVRSNWDILREVPFFKQFPCDLQEQLFTELRVETYGDGDLIVKHNDEGDRMFVIVSGEIVVWRKNEATGESKDITHLYSHDYFGELALVYGQDRNSNVSSIGKTTVMYLTKASFEKFEKIRVYMVVQKIPLLNKVDPELQTQIVRRLRPKIYEKGDYVVKQGDIGDAFYMISKGSAKVEENGEVSTHLYEGHTFGQMALLSGDARLASVRAAEQLICMELKAKDFQELIADDKNKTFAELITKDEQTIRRRRSKRDARKNQSRHHVYDSFDESSGFCFGSSSSSGAFGVDRQISVDSAAGGIASLNMSTNGPPGTPTGGSSATAASWGSPMIMDESKKSSKFAARRASAATRRASVSSTGTVMEDNSVMKTQRGGRKVINGFVFIKEIGQGSFGKVKLCEHEKTGEKFAIKIIDKGLIKSNKISVHIPGLEEMRQEVIIMKRLRHPNIVNLVAVIDDPSAEHLYIVTEYCKKGAIMNGLEDNEPVTEAVARGYFRDMLLGLHYLHHQNIVHRDIKPMNLLLTHDNVVKIADFGAARIIVGENKWISGITGTPAFMSPELLVEDKEVYDGPAVDMWSCGATLFMFITGTPPWMSKDEIALSKKVKNDELMFPPNWNQRNFSPHLRNLITQLLMKDPNERLTLAATFQHDWVTDEGSDPLLPLEVYDDVLDEDEEDNVGDDTDPIIQTVVRRGDSHSTFGGGTSSSVGSSIGIGHSLSSTAASSIHYPPTVHLKKGTNKRSLSKPKPNTDLDLGDGIVDVEEGYDSDGSDFSQVKSSGAGSGAGGDWGRIGRTGMLAEAKNSGTSTNRTKTAVGPLSPRFNDKVPKPSDVLPLNVKRGGQKCDWVHARVAHHSEKNSRLNQEDRVLVIPKLVPGSKEKKLLFYHQSNSSNAKAALFAGVFDGHGGALVSERLREHLAKVIASQETFASEPGNFTDALTSGFLEMNRRMLHEAATFIQSKPKNVGLTRTKCGRNSSEFEELQKAGSTAAVVLLHQANGAVNKHMRALTCAWVGDSRAVLSRAGVAIQLSQDHTATRNDEVKRIREAGGTVHNGRVDSVLAVTRSFGDIQHVGLEVLDLAAMNPIGKSPADDKMLSNGIVIAKPDVCTQPVEEQDEFVLIASDGLFDALPSNQMVVNFIRHQLELHGDVDLAVKALIEYASKLCPDNITIALIVLQF